MLCVCTTSTFKFSQFKEYFESRGIEVNQLFLDIPELQAIQTRVVVKDKLIWASKQTTKRPLLVDDAGIHIDALNGFPGALLKPLLELGGVLLLKNLLNSVLHDSKCEAKLVSSIGMDNGGHIVVEDGVMRGTLDFGNKEFWNKKDCTDIFYPENETQSLSQLKQLYGDSVYKHRYLSLEKISKHIKATYES